MVIKSGRMVVSDSKDNIIKTMEGISCGCGKSNLKMVAHADGMDFYQTTYNCVSCGNVITSQTKRRRSDRW